MHLQYVDWPDHGIPDDPQPFLSELVHGSLVGKNVAWKADGRGSSPTQGSQILFEK